MSESEKAIARRNGMVLQTMKRTKTLGIPIPSHFLAVPGPGDFVFRVKGAHLTVAKNLLSYHSRVLDKTVNDIGFIDARRGYTDLEGKTLNDILAFLYWLYKTEDPKESAKTYGKVGLALRISMEDLGGLLALADEWEVKALLRDCRLTVMDYAAGPAGPKAATLKALGSLEMLGLEEDELSEVLAGLIEGGVTVEDVKALAVSADFRFTLLEMLLSRFQKREEKEHLCFHCRRPIQFRCSEYYEHNQDCDKSCKVRCCHGAAMASGSEYAEAMAFKEPTYQTFYGR